MTYAQPVKLVAKFLLTHGYIDTLHAFSHEAGIELDTFDDVESLEEVLEERRLRELQNQLARVRLAETELPRWVEQKWTQRDVLTLPSNVLFVTVADSQIIVSCADRSIKVFDYDTLELLQTITNSSPILDVIVHDKKFITAGMDGHVKLTDADGSVSLHSHQKYANRLSMYGSYLASSGYDKRINLYHDFKHTNTLNLTTTPESITFIHHDRLILLVSARDTPFLDFYAVPEMTRLTRWNMNENNDLWVSFSAIDISVLSGDTITLIISTSVERVLILSAPWSRITSEDGEISRKSVFTQSQYSDYGVLPRHVAGLWTNSDDGIIRGTCLQTGDNKLSLRAHEGAVRSLWSGKVHDKEVLVSGGFDKRVVIHTT